MIEACFEPEPWPEDPCEEELERCLEQAEDDETAERCFMGADECFEGSEPPPPPEETCEAALDLCLSYSENEEEEFICFGAAEICFRSENPQGHRPEDICGGALDLCLIGVEAEEFEDGEAAVELCFEAADACWFAQEGENI